MDTSLRFVLHERVVFIPTQLLSCGWVVVWWLGGGVVVGWWCGCMGRRVWLGGSAVGGWCGDVVGFVVFLICSFEWL